MQCARTTQLNTFKLHTLHKQYLLYKCIEFDWDLMSSSSFLSQFSENDPNLYDDAEDFDYEYVSSDDDLFSTTSINGDKLDHIYELEPVSPDKYLVPDSHIEAADMESILKHTAQEDATSEDDENKPVPKRKSIAHHYMSSKLAFISFDVETGDESCGIVQISANIFRVVDKKRGN